MSFLLWKMDDCSPRRQAFRHLDQASRTYRHVCRCGHLWKLFWSEDAEPRPSSAARPSVSYRLQKHAECGVDAVSRDDISFAGTTPCILIVSLRSAARARRFSLPPLLGMSTCIQCFRYFPHEQAWHAHCRDKADHNYCIECRQLFLHVGLLWQVGTVCRIIGRSGQLTLTLSHTPSHASTCNILPRTMTATTMQVKLQPSAVKAAEGGSSQGSISISTSQAALDTTGALYALVILGANWR